MQLGRHAFVGRPQHDPVDQAAYDLAGFDPRGSRP
jgi:hypothetical protein